MRTGIVPGRQDSPHRHTGLQAHRKTGTEKNSEDFWSKTEENRQIHGIL
jgi:hypothetical protein